MKVNLPLSSGKSALLRLHAAILSGLRYAGCLSVFILTGQQPRLVLPVGHAAALQSAVFSVDGKQIITGGWDRTVRVWEAESGNELQVLEGHTSIVRSIAQSPDGRFLASSSLDSTVRIWDYTAGKNLHILRGHSANVATAVFSPDGRKVLTASWDHTARLWDVAEGKELRVFQGHTDWLFSAVFSKDGTRILTGSRDGTARLWDANTGNMLLVLKGHTQAVESALFSPDGLWVLTAGWDKTARLWDAKTGRELRKFSGHAGYVRTARFSPDGAQVLTAGWDSIARLWDAGSGTLLQSLAGHTGFIEAAAFSPDGLRIITAGADGTARLWESQTGKQRHILQGHSGRVVAALFDPDGKTAVTAGWDHTARSWATENGAALQVLRGDIPGLQTSIIGPDGTLAATATRSGHTAVWEISSGRHLQTLRGMHPVFAPDNSRLLTSNGVDTVFLWNSGQRAALQVFTGSTGIFSMDGQQVLTTCADSSLRIWKTADGTLTASMKGHTGRILCAAFSKDGQRVISGSDDQTARVWNPASGREELRLSIHAGRVVSVAFSPDASMALTAGADSLVRIWDARSGALLTSLTGHRGYVYTAVFSNDGRRVLTAGLDRTARIWDAGSGKALYTLQGHNRPVIAAAFSSDDQWVLTASWDQTIRIWETESGRQLQVLNSHTHDVRAAAFGPDKSWILSAGEDNRTILWDAARGSMLCTRLQLDAHDWLVHDTAFHFDGSAAAIEKLYFACGLEIVELGQLKDSLWIPGLSSLKIQRKPLQIDDRPAPGIRDLDLCGITPLVAPLDDSSGQHILFRITPRRGGLGTTEVYIHGNRTFVFAPEELHPEAGSNPPAYLLPLTFDTLQPYLTGSMQPGTYPLLVKAHPLRSGIQGRGALLRRELSGRRAEQARFFGVIIGVNNYGNPSGQDASRYRDLQFASSDAAAFASAMRLTSGGLFKDSVFLYLLNGSGSREPTRENLRQVLADIGKEARAADVLCLFFAGHGDMVAWNGEKQVRFMLEEADRRNPISSSFGLKELNEWCQPAVVRAQKRVFIYDACHSGNIIGEMTAMGSRGDDEAVRIRQLDKLKDRNGMIILAAAAGNQLAYEDAALGQGVLTYHLLQAAKAAPDSFLQVRHWFDQTLELMEAYRRTQHIDQEPNSFGDGRFEIGLLNDSIRNRIQVAAPKERVVFCRFVFDSRTEARFPGLREALHTQLQQHNAASSWVYTPGNTANGWQVIGNVTGKGKKLSVRYEVTGRQAQAGKTIDLPARKYAGNTEIISSIVGSLELYFAHISAPH